MAQHQAAQPESLLVQIDSRSSQYRVPGADHYFSGRETESAAVISDWLDALFTVENLRGL